MGNHIPVYDLIDVIQASRIANVNPNRIYNMINRGVLASEKRAGRTFVLRREVQAYADERKRRIEQGLPLRKKYDLSPPEERSEPKPEEPPKEEPEQTLDLAALEEKPDTNVAAAFEQALHKSPVSPVFGPKQLPPALPATSAPPALTLSPSPTQFAVLRERVRHELGAVRHQFSAIDDQIKKLEAHALELTAREEEYVKRLAQIDELEAFAKDFS